MTQQDRTTTRGAYDRMVKAWSPPNAKRACARDPKAGPGSCGHWWEGCPKAEERGCFLAHMKAWAAGPRRGAQT